MAKEEVDENESGEEEEAEEEEERPKKKRKRAPHERPRGRHTRAHGSFAEPRLYSKGVPIGPNGTALEDVPMSIGDIERIGAFDEESARITENSRRVLSRKASGEADVKFNSDSRTKYFDIRKYYPGAIIAITQVYPVKNEALRPTSFAACPNYDALLGYVRDHYWKGDDAAYVWRAYTETKSALGIGRFEFAADPDWEPGGRREPQHQQAPQQQPQQPQNPFGQFGMPGVMMPGVGGMPPIFMPQQSQPQPQQTHQQNPVAAPVAGDPMAVIGPLLNYLLPLISNQASQSAYLQGLPQMIEQKVKEATPPPAAVAPPAPPPPTPVEQMEQAANIISTVQRTARSIAHSVGLQHSPTETELPPPGADDDFPWQIRRVGPLNLAAQDGKVVDNLLLQGAVNAGPVLGLVDTFFKKLSESKKEAAEIELKTIQEKRKWEEQRLENLREAEALQSKMQAPQHYPQPDKPPPWSVERQPIEPDPTT